MTASKSDSSMLKIILSRKIPALLTMMSMPPKVSTARSKISFAPFESPTSAVESTASPPSAWISSTTAWPTDAVAPDPSSSTPMSATTTFAPSAARPSASARPIPLPAPVTIATRPAQRSPIACSPPTASKRPVTIDWSRRTRRRSGETSLTISFEVLLHRLRAPLRRDFVALFITAPDTADKAPSRPLRVSPRFQPRQRPTSARARLLDRSTSVADGHPGDGRERPDGRSLPVIDHRVKMTGRLGPRLSRSGT